VELLRILAIPFQLGSLLFVAISSLILALVLPDPTSIFSVLGIFGVWVVLTWLTRYAFRLIDDVANGVREAATADVEMVNPVGDARCWVHPALAAALVIAHVLHPDWPLAPSLVAGALLFAPSLAACAMSGRVRDALNPLAVGRVILGMGPWYPAAVLASATCVALAVIMARALSPGWMLYASLELLVLLAYAGIGGVIYLRRFELGFAARISPERREATAALERDKQRQQWLDEIFTTVRSRDPARAVAQVTQWLEAASPAQVGGDLQALIEASKTWNEPREFARLLRGLLPLMLARRQGALALAAFDAGVAAHAAFAPAEESTAVELAGFAVQSGRRRAALRILESYLATGGVATDSPARTLYESLRAGR
jgi:hypothetical protein